MYSSTIQISGNHYTFNKDRGQKKETQVHDRSQTPEAYLRFPFMVVTISQGNKYTFFILILIYLASLSPRKRGESRLDFFAFLVLKPQDIWIHYKIPPRIKLLVAPCQTKMNLSQHWQNISTHPNLYISTIHMYSPAIHFKAFLYT